MQDAIIIGAGPAGLTAAYELDKLGMSSTILEADSIVGGISRTEIYKGFRFDMGGHRFFSKVPYVNQLWNEILKTDFLVRPRLSRIHYRGHFFDYPLKPLNALSGLGLLESVMVGFSFARTRVFPHQDEENFEQWVSNRFGYRLYNIFFKNYTEKVWGIPCREISADWAAQRIKNLSLTEAVRNAVFGGGRSKDGKVITTLIEEFHYPRLGPGMMWETCEDILNQKGSKTLHQLRVEKIKHRAGIVESVLARNGNGELTEFQGRQFISTMPLRDMIFALDPAPPDNILQAASRLRYRDYLTVVLIVDRQEVFPDNWIYIHTPEVKMGRIQNYKNWSPAMVPDPSHTSLGLEYFVWEKDEEWSWPDDRLIELGIKECSHIGLIDPSEVLDGTVVRMKKTYPIYDQYYHDTLAELKGFIAGFENLQTIGRNGLHRYNNQDHSMLTGVYAARNLTGEKNDVWSVNTEKEYHEETTVEPATSGDRLVPTALPSQLKEEKELVEVLMAPLDSPAFGFAAAMVAGAGLFISTIFLILKGGVAVGQTLSLIGEYLPGYTVSWKGAVIGFLEGGLAGGIIGLVLSSGWNLIIRTYLAVLRRKAEAEENIDLLDKV